MCDYGENSDDNMQFQGSSNEKEPKNCNAASNALPSGRPTRKRKKTVKSEKLDNFPCLRKGRQDLPLREKIKILEILEKDPKTPQRVIASTFKVSQSQISRIQNNREKLKSAWQCGNVNRKRNRRGKGGSIEMKLLEWYNEAKRDGLPISGPTLMEKAKSIAHEINLDFTPTSGWFGRWKNRNGVTLKLAKNDDASLAFNKISIHWRRYTFSRILRECDLENIWFLDSLILLSKALPDDLESNVNNSDMGKMLIFFAFNYFGRERSSPLIFGREKSAVDTSALNYYNCLHSNAVSGYFTKWLVQWDKELGSKRRKISLFLCRASDLPETLNLPYINLHYFPEGEVNDLRLQPFHFGISSTFKALFRHQVATRFLSYKLALPKEDFPSTRKQNSASWSTSAPIDDLLDVIFIIRRAWKHVHPDVFVRGVVKAGLSKQVQSLGINADVAPPPGMTSDDFERFVNIEDRFYTSLDFLSFNNANKEAFLQLDVEVPPVTEPEALLACSVLKKYLQRKQNLDLTDLLAEIESDVQRQVLATEDRGIDIHCSIDPLYDFRSIHSIGKHANSVVKQETHPIADPMIEHKLSSDNQTNVGTTSETLLDDASTINTMKFSGNYPSQEVLLPHPEQQPQGGMDDRLKSANASHCEHVTTLPHGNQNPQPVGQYQTTTNYIPQNLELKSIAIGVPRTISDVSIDRFTIHPDVQHARPVNDMNSHIIPATQLTNQAPTFITFASHF